MKSLVATFLAVMTLIPTFALSPTNEDIKIEIWDNTTAPHSNNLTQEIAEPNPYRWTFNSSAELLIFEADREKQTGQAVMIFPGGGYQMLSMDHEGTILAEWFAKNGITAAVLKYRMPNGVGVVPYEDVMEAMKVMRMRSRQLGYDFNKIGVVGSSAGGHLAAYASTFAPKEEKPAFTILFYPVISGEKGVAHEGSFNNLLGKDRTEEQTMTFSLESRVNDDTPPAIMFHCQDDTVVPAENSVRYYTELHKRGIFSSLYIFPKGGHGWGVSDRVTFRDEWQSLLLQWLEILNNDKNNNKK
ncbi:MAG: alpha/beta hydrolase [Rikenellaceae bacterium]